MSCGRQLHRDLVRPGHSPAARCPPVVAQRFPEQVSGQARTAAPGRNVTVTASRSNHRHLSSPKNTDRDTSRFQHMRDIFHQWDTDGYKSLMKPSRAACRNSKLIQHMTPVVHAGMAASANIGSMNCCSKFQLACTLSPWCAAQSISLGTQYFMPENELLRVS